MPRKPPVSPARQRYLDLEDGDVIELEASDGMAASVHVIDQEDPARALVRKELRALFKQARLRDGDLPQRTVGEKCDHVGMRTKHQGMVAAVVGAHLRPGSQQLRKLLVIFGTLDWRDASAVRAQAAEIAFGLRVM